MGRPSGLRPREDDVDRLAGFEGPVRRLEADPAQGVAHFSLRVGDAEIDAFRGEDAVEIGKDCEDFDDLKKVALAGVGVDDGGKVHVVPWCFDADVGAYLRGCARLGSVEGVVARLERGDDVEAADSKDQYRRRAVHWCCGEGHDEVLLVLDGTNGQNAIAQAEQFKKVVKCSGIILTKLDGTAKGGIAFAIAQDIERPIRYIGTGEKMTDLALFDSQQFVNSLFGE